MDAIAINDVSVVLGNRTILEDIHFTIPTGKITTLIGPNGCGKSTLLKTLIGHIKAEKGTVSIQGKAISQYSPRELAQHMAFLPQVPDMPRDMTVEELVYCGRFPYQVWWKNTAAQDREAVDRALAITKTEHLRNQLMPSLSGGERQRVWIAMALAQEPEFLVLDEPTTYLDINHQLEIMELLKRLNKESSLTVLMVLHELTQAVQYSHQLAVINEGHLVDYGPADQVMTQQLLANVFHVEGIVEREDNRLYVKIKKLTKQQ